MRADRLVATLMLLQTRGRITAAELAAELEVSERTARRDLEALGTAGVPVYSQPGRNGGWQLVGGARTDLSGLTSAEARVLFLVAGPASATPQVKSALRKLVRALPEPFRADAEAASAALIVDTTAWGRSAPQGDAPPRHLEAIQHAVIDGEQVVLGYVARDREPSTRVVHPLGLATKGTAWYLVADTEAGLRTFRVDRVTSVGPTGAPVVRPQGFDLAEAWRMITVEVGDRWTAVWARGRSEPDLVPLLRMVFGKRIRIGPTAPGGRVEVEIGGEGVRSLAGQLAGFAGRLEVVDPPELRGLLARIGAELVDVYAPSGRGPTAPPDQIV